MTIIVSDYQKMQPIRSTISMGSTVEYLFGACLIGNAFVFIPQIVKIVKSKNTHNLSILTYLGFNVVQLITILRGIITGDYVLAFGNACAFVTSGVVTVLIIFYSYKNVKI